MRSRSLLLLALLGSMAFGAVLPRKASDITVQLPNGKQQTVSQYRGKVLCLIFMLTTCPHCQKTTQVLNGIYKDLSPKGFEVLEAAVNEDGDIPDFQKKFNPLFPIGKVGAMNALEFIQWPKGERPLVPFLVFIDREGTIRAQFTGVDTEFFNDQQDQHIRAEVTKLLNESPPKKH